MAAVVKPPAARSNLAPPRALPRRRQTWTLAVIAALVWCPAPMAMAESYHWLQHARGRLEVRAITGEEACPATAIDGSPVAMSIRAAPSRDFPILACVLPLPPSAAGRPTQVTVAGVPVALPSAALNRIAVIGDTGCRLKGSVVQACNDPTQWPFRLIAEVVAQLKPDLVIHVGDYHYRETPCPPGKLQCAGSPHGDVWPAWRADFFAPADTLLKVAPWVFVRGNHEDCRRGGRGWSRALDPDPFDAERGCNGIGRPFAVRTGDLTLAVMDVSSAREDAVDDTQVPIYREHYRALEHIVGGPAWLLQHRPIWAPFAIIDGRVFGGNKTLAVAAAGVIPREVGLILSGHYHLFQALSYEGDVPAQIVSGHGGDKLNLGLPPDAAGWVIDGATIKAGLNAPGMFGFALFERYDDGWRLSDRDRMGVEQRSCLLKGRAIACAAD
jgi:hypothetical protein